MSNDQHDDFDDDSDVLEEEEQARTLVMTVPIEAGGNRLDKVLRQMHPDLSRSQWQRLVRQKHVTIGEEPVRANYKVAGGERVTAVLPPPEPSHIVAEDIPLDVIYEDDDLIAINKPAGLVMHPAPGHPRGTLANAVIYHWPDTLDVGGQRRPGLVHRLDKETSGVVLVAKNTAALNYMKAQFKARDVHKTYTALTEGHIEPVRALIDAPLGRNPNNRMRMAVIEPGQTAKSQPSQTRYERVETLPGYALVMCYPITGRTHQIRVHLAYIGYPVAADTMYGRRKRGLPINRQFLHATRISFRRPADGKRMELEAPLAPELADVLEQLRRQRDGG